MGKILTTGVILDFYAIHVLEYVTKVYHKIASPNTSHLEVHVGFFRLLMQGIFGCYVL